MQKRHKRIGHAILRVLLDQLSSVVAVKIDVLSTCAIRIVHLRRVPVLNKSWCDAL